MRVAPRARGFTVERQLDGDLSVDEVAELYPDAGCPARIRAALESGELPGTTRAAVCRWIECTVARRVPAFTPPSAEALASRVRVRGGKREYVQRVSDATSGIRLTGKRSRSQDQAA